MSIPLRPLAAAVVLATGAIVLFACGDEPAPVGPSDTGATALATWKAFYRPPTDRVPHALATRPGTPWGDYVGSEACRACHEQAFAGWSDSFHSRTLYDARARSVFGDFSGERTFDDPAFPFVVRPYASGGRYLMHVARRNGVPRLSTDGAGPAGGGVLPDDSYGAGVPAVPEGDFEVLYAFGNRRHQPYVAKTPDGKAWVLPVVWDDVIRGWSWGGWRPYVEACASCHVTGIKSVGAPSVPPRRAADGTLVAQAPIAFTNPTRWPLPPAQEGWAEGAVGCEACHGPGRAHVETAASLGRAAYRAYLADGGEPTIYDPGKDTPARRMAQCDSCHDFFTESSATFVPGPRGYSHEPMRDPIRPETPGMDRQFHRDGTHMSPCTVGHVLRASKMGAKGVECRDCHAAHGNAHWAELTAPTSDNALCLRCHATDPSRAFESAAAVARHARHAATGPGILCVECHMPRDKRFSDGIHVMSAQIHSHAMSIPTGREPERGGPPSACALCHTDRDDAWTRATLADWARERAAGR